MLSWGKYILRAISGGRFRLDGGAMFGVVPKPLWERQAPADEANRIPLDTNCLLVERPRANQDSEYLLIDTGFGNYRSSKESKQLAIEASPWPTRDALANLGIRVEQITAVTFSHLHFDHAGGAVYLDPATQSYLPTFPLAKHFIQRSEWEDAMGNFPELAGNYAPPQLLPLLPLIHWVDDECELWPDIQLQKTGGHSAGHQIIRIFDENAQQAVFTGDLFPTTAHLRPLWNMGYDQNQRLTRQLKRQLLIEFAEQGSLMLLDHDPQFQAMRVQQTDNEAWQHAELLSLRHD